MACTSMRVGEGEEWLIEKGEFEGALKPPDSSGRYNKPPPLPRTSSHTSEQEHSTVGSIGLDLGLAHAVIISDGQKIDNPRYYLSQLDRLRHEQRRLSRKQKGSRNRRKQQRKVARLHGRIADMRRDWCHKLTTDLVRRYDVICIETLNVKGMLRNHCLAQSIADVAWAEIKRQLRYKAAWYGSRLVEISPWEATSKTCHQCGHRLAALPLSARSWLCDGCGVEHDRDVNASLNVLAAGLAVLASGLNGSPVTALSVAGVSG